MKIKLLHFELIANDVFLFNKPGYEAIVVEIAISKARNIIFNRTTF